MFYQVSIVVTLSSLKGVNNLESVSGLRISTNIHMAFFQIAIDIRNKKISVEISSEFVIN